MDNNKDEVQYLRALVKEMRENDLKQHYKHLQIECPLCCNKERRRPIRLLMDGVAYGVLVLVLLFMIALIITLMTGR